MLRWGIGAVMRFFVLVLYAPIARIVNLSLEAALVSLVTFFFMTMMAEPLLLEYDRLPKRFHHAAQPRLAHARLPVLPYGLCVRVRTAALESDPHRAIRPR